MRMNLMLLFWIWRRTFIINVFALPAAVAFTLWTTERL